jgi:hypothetical protein
MSKIVRDQYFVSPATGRTYWVDKDGRAHLEDEMAPDEDQYGYSGPTCSLCDAPGHGYPGAGPCPLEERGSWSPDD